MRINSGGELGMQRNIRGNSRADVRLDICRVILIQVCLLRIIDSSRRHGSGLQVFVELSLSLEREAVD